MYKGNRLDDFKWDGGENFDKLVHWGVCPARSLVGVLDDFCFNTKLEVETAYPIINELQCKLEDLEKTIRRFILEMEEEKEAPEPAQPGTDSEAGK